MKKHRHAAPFSDKQYILYTFIGLLSFTAQTPTTMADEENQPCQKTTVVSVSVMHTWPRACESKGKCWREITMFTDGLVEFADNDGFIQDSMDQLSTDTLNDIIETSSLLLKLDNPLAPDCPGYDGVDDTEIRVELSNGAILSTKWAGGCRHIEGHPFKLVNDLAVRQRVETSPAAPA